MAIRATSGHTFSGEGKRPLGVNIDFDNMNVKLTRELAFSLAGGYHVTRFENLTSIILKGLVPGGGAGGRDHVFFGEYAPWDPLNSSTISFLDRDTKNLLVLYIPVRRLLNYRVNITFNGDVIVRETIPFHEVTDVWIAGSSPGINQPATNPKKITSDKIVNEVVCQCEFATKSVPKEVLEGVKKGLISMAEEKRRSDIVKDLNESWSHYANSPISGTAATSMGAALVVARQEVCPKESAKTRLCPNCMFRTPRNLLMCPQCRGQFVSAGTVNQNAPVITILSKEEIEEKVKEREEMLKEENFPQDIEAGGEHGDWRRSERICERKSDHGAPKTQGRRSR